MNGKGIRVNGLRGPHVLRRSTRRRCSSPGFPGPNYDRTWLDPTFSSKKKTTKHTNDTKKKRRKKNLLVVARSVRRCAGAKPQAAAFLFSCFSCVSWFMVGPHIQFEEKNHE